MPLAEVQLLNGTFGSDLYTAFVSLPGCAQADFLMLFMEAANAELSQPVAAVEPARIEVGAAYSTVVLHTVLWN